MSEKHKLCQVAKYQAEYVQIKDVLGKPFFTAAHTKDCGSGSGIYFITSVLSAVLLIKYFV